MPLRDDLLNSIPGDRAGGQDLRYAPLYDKVKEARREEEDISQGDWQHEIKRADYPLVLKLCQEALATKSKDLQLAAWLAEALLWTDGFAGLQQGLDLVRGLLETFWDTLYPQLEDGDAELRAAPLDWIGSRFGELVKNVPLTKSGYTLFRYKESRAVGYEEDASGEEKEEARAQAIRDGKLTAEEFDKGVAETPKDFYRSSRQSIEECLRAVDSLREVCEGKFPHDVRPSFSRVREALEEVRGVVRSLLQKKLEQDPEIAAEPVGDAVAEEPFEAVAVSGGAAAAPARAPVARFASEQPVSRDDAFRRVIAAATFLRKENTSDPVPYLLLRALRWGELRAMGESPDVGQLEAPTSDVRKLLRALSAEGDFEELLQAAEEAMGTPAGRAWLDLQRHTVRACEELGHSAAAAAIRAEIVALLRDYRELLEGCLNDETPTASAETKSWLQEFAFPEEAVPPEPAGEEEGAEPPTVAELARGGMETPPAKPPDALEVAREALAQGRPREAIEILMREATQERSGRGRFCRRLQLSEICLAAGHEQVAAPILAGLADEIEARKLDEWESSDFVAHALVLLMRCLEKTNAPPEKKQRLYERICRLDAVQALRIAG